jgi:glycosyltransferase involved in cell wall biosynthesis
MRVFRRAIPEAQRPAFLRRLLERVPDGIPRDRIAVYPSFAVEYAWRLARARTPSERTRTYLWAGQRFCDLVLARGFDAATAIYAYNTAGREALEAGRSQGRLCVVEQTIAPPLVEHRLLREEAARFPGWEALPPDDVLLDALMERHRAEWEAADLVLCGSEFVRDSVVECGGPAHCTKVVPYGVELDFGARPAERPPGPLRVLTVGTVGLRKGIPYVLEAARRLRKLAELRLVGAIGGLLPQAVRELRGATELTGSVPRSLVRDHYVWADVFLLPSLCEGSATVSYEALAAGIPVVTTPNAGSVIRDGTEGFVVPIRDVDAIVERIELLAKDRALLAHLGRHAAARAREFTVERYRDRLMAALFPLRRKERIAAGAPEGASA